MSGSDQVSLSRRSFCSAWGAFLGGALVGRQRPSVVQAATTDGTPAEDMTKEITVASLAEAEAVIGVSFSDTERALMLDGVRRQRDTFQRRRRQGFFENSAAPALVFDPRPPGFSPLPQENRVTLRRERIPPLPASAVDIAYAPLTYLSHWIRNQELTSERLTRIYLDRLQRYDAQLHCVITRTTDRALEQAQRADREIAAGRYRGPLHGIPWGAKDLLDTRDIRTTWGAAPFKDRVSTEDAWVVERLEEAGAVLVAKLTLGALAMGDVWFDDVTRNPFRPEEGSSGSSAGSAAAVAAGLVGFALGTETLGSIVSPCMRCGTTGLRPSFGRVGRSGAMTLCWSLDKIGPICRRVEDTALVLAAINGHDSADVSSIDVGFDYDGRQSLSGLRIGYHPAWFEGEGKENDRTALEAVRRLGGSLVEVTLPDEPYGSLYTILNVEAAAAFEELTFSGRDDQLVRQQAGAWPNIFRKAWMVPAVELLQADRLRRRVMEHLAQVYESVDVLISPSFAASLLVMTNFTGHPALTIRTGFRRNGTPTGITLWGGLFAEGPLCALGAALETELNVWDQRPAMFL